ncbi:DNA-formamidopyrimidine glycosylase family protein [Nocardioides sp. YIM 152315]|uniref:Fpg/Nei family DNA glycosylase n=1 Tax=Nocardioides sp. YIM 152315 TaxID=3031760 RepID=UPI0023DA791E|nr:DNA-formamidopyrimidine glycosylase family protein [Nocardioides sp. YIM 152315]MDF1603669.1 Fpg/Nei family DNA glycosylase [Nocardioides sp. YIM 152315]
MPEGHTLHRLAGELTATFGSRVVRVSSPQGRFAESAALLDGEVLAGAEAWGKHLFVSFPGDRFVHVHLGLYGKLDVHAEVPVVPAPVGQVRLRLVAETVLVGGDPALSYADLRGATACELLTRAERDLVVARSGPDPLRADADPGVAWARIRRSRAPIGGLLMDQTVLAGVGNVYRAELLFRHRIDPYRPGNTLRVGQWQAMWDDLVVLMREGVRTGRIDTVRPEHTPEAMGRPPRRDDHGGEVYVYRRNGMPCHVCGRVVRTAELQGRNLFWCAQCQRRYRSRALQ